MIARMLVCALLLLAPVLTAQGGKYLTATPHLEGLKDGKAVPGESFWFKLRFETERGYHGYHKDCKTMPPLELKLEAVKGTEIGEAQWPEPIKKPSDMDPKETDLLLPEHFEISWPIKVRQGAEGTLVIKGKFSGQVCDPESCVPVEGEFEIEVPILVVAQPDLTPGVDLKPLENKVKDLNEGQDALSKEVADLRAGIEAVRKLLEKQQLDPAAVDEHGFYLDYDYAAKLAEDQGKRLFLDFNGFR